jgi:hypothetical protein
MVSLLSFGASRNKFGVQNGTLAITSGSTLSHNITPVENSYGSSVSTYRYDGSGQLLGGAGTSSNRTEASVYNSETSSYVTKKTYSTSEQTFGAFGGQPVLTKQVTVSRENNPTDPNNYVVSTLSYTIGADGRTESASGTNVTHTMVAHDPTGTGNLSYVAKVLSGTMSQTFGTYGGQSVVTAQTNGSTNSNSDGSSDGQTVTMTYTHDKAGRMTAASGTGTTTGNDGLGQTSTGSLYQTFVILNGNATVKSSRSVSDSSGKGTSHSDVTTTSSYDSDGRLSSMHASGTMSGTNVSESGQVNPFSGSIEQEFVVRAGTGLMAKAINTNISSSIEEGIRRTNTTVITTAYTYDAMNRLVAANATGTIQAVSADTRSATKTQTTTAHYDDWGGETGLWGWQSTGGGGVGWDGDSSAMNWVLVPVAPPADTSTDSGESVVGSYVQGTGTITQKLGIFYGQAKVLESKTKTTTTTYLSVGRGTTSTKYALSFKEVPQTSIYSSWIFDYEGVPTQSGETTREPVFSRDVTTTESIYNTSKVTEMESTETYGVDDNGKQYGTLKVVQNGWTQKGGGAQVHFSMTHTNHTWDAQGRPTSYTEDRWNEGTGSSHAVRSNILYNGLGQVYSYLETFSKDGGAPATIQVHWIAYDAAGRESQKNQTVNWSFSTYGNVPGLQDGYEGWQNGQANVTINTSYDGSDRVIATSASGTVFSASNSDLATKRDYFTSFDFSSSTFNIVYDAFGRQISSSYNNYMPGVFQKKKKQWAVMVWTTGTNEVRAFDAFDRATSTYSTYQKSVNRASGWSLNTDIKYNDVGNVVSQSERYYSFSRNSGIKSRTNGEKTITFSYDAQNQLVARNETKLWEKTKTSGGGNGIFKAIIGAVISFVIMWVSGVYIDFTSLFAAEAGMEGLTLGAAAAAGNVSAMGAMAGIAFVASFTATLVTGGSFKMALTSGLFAAVMTFAAYSFGSWMSSTEGGAASVQPEPIDPPSVPEKSILDVASEKLMASFGPTLNGAPNIANTLKFTSQMVTKLAGDVVGIVVSGTMGEKVKSNLGFLSGLVTSFIMGTLTSQGGSFFTSRSLMASVLRVGAGFAIQKALGPKNAWLSGFFIALFAFNGNPSEPGKIDVVSYSRELPFFEMTPQNWAGGLVAAAGAKLLEKIQARYADEMYEWGTSKLSAAGHLLVINVNGAFSELAKGADRLMNSSKMGNSFVPGETIDKNIRHIDQMHQDGKLTDAQVSLLMGMNPAALDQLMKVVGLKFESIAKAREGGDEWIQGKIKVDNVADGKNKEALLAAGKSLTDIVDFRVNNRTGEVFFKVDIDQAHLEGFINTIVADQAKAKEIATAFNALGKNATFVSEFTLNKGLGGYIEGTATFNTLPASDFKDAMGRLGFKENDAIKMKCDLRSGKMTVQSGVEIKSLAGLEKMGVTIKESVKPKVARLAEAGANLGMVVDVTALATGKGNEMNAAGFLFNGANGNQLDRSLLSSDAAKTLDILKGGSISGQMDEAGTIKEAVIVPVNMAAVVELINSKKAEDLQGTPLEALARTNLSLSPDAIKTVSFQFGMRDDGVPYHVATLVLFAANLNEATTKTLTDAGMSPVKENGISLFKIELMTNAVDGTHLYQTGGSDKLVAKPLNGTGIEKAVIINGIGVKVMLDTVGANGTRAVLNPVGLDMGKGPVKDAAGNLLVTLDGNATITPTRVTETKSGDAYRIVEFKLSDIDSHGLGAQLPNDPNRYRGGEITVFNGALVSVTNGTERLIELRNANEKPVFAVQKIKEGSWSGMTFADAKGESLRPSDLKAILTGGQIRLGGKWATISNVDQTNGISLSVKSGENGFEIMKGVRIFSDNGSGIDVRLGQKGNWQLGDGQGKIIVSEYNRGVGDNGYRLMEGDGQAKEIPFSFKEGAVILSQSQVLVAPGGKLETLLSGHVGIVTNAVYQAKMEITPSGLAPTGILAIDGQNPEQGASGSGAGESPTHSQDTQLTVNLDKSLSGFVYAQAGQKFMNLGTLTFEKAGLSFQGYTAVSDGASVTRMSNATIPEKGQVYHKGEDPSRNLVSIYSAEDGRKTMTQTGWLSSDTRKTTFTGLEMEWNSETKTYKETSGHVEILLTKDEPERGLKEGAVIKTAYGRNSLAHFAETKDIDFVLHGKNVQKEAVVDLLSPGQIKNWSVTLMSRGSGQADQTSISATWVDGFRTREVEGSIDQRNGFTANGTLVDKNTGELLRANAVNPSFGLLGKYFDRPEIVARYEEGKLTDLQNTKTLSAKVTAQAVAVAVFKPTKTMDAPSFVSDPVLSGTGSHREQIIGTTYVVGSGQGQKLTDNQKSLAGSLGVALEKGKAGLLYGAASSSLVAVENGFLKGDVIERKPASQDLFVVLDGKERPAGVWDRRTNVYSQIKDGVAVEALGERKVVSGSNILYAQVSKAPPAWMGALMEATGARYAADGTQLKTDGKYALGAKGSHAYVPTAKGVMVLTAGTNGRFSQVRSLGMEIKEVEKDKLQVSTVSQKMVLRVNGTIETSVFRNVLRNDSFSRQVDTWYKLNSTDNTPNLNAPVKIMGIYFTDGNGFIKGSTLKEPPSGTYVSKVGGTPTGRGGLWVAHTSTTPGAWAEGFLAGQIGTLKHQGVTLNVTIDKSGKVQVGDNSLTGKVSDAKGNPVEVSYSVYGVQLVQGRIFLNHVLTAKAGQSFEVNAETPHSGSAPKTPASSGFSIEHKIDHKFGSKGEVVSGVAIITAQVDGAKVAGTMEINGTKGSVLKTQLSPLVEGSTFIGGKGGFSYNGGVVKEGQMAHIQGGKLEGVVAKTMGMDATDTRALIGAATKSVELNQKTGSWAGKGQTVSYEGDNVSGTVRVDMAMGRMTITMNDMTTGRSYGTITSEIPGLKGAAGKEITNALYQLNVATPQEFKDLLAKGKANLDVSLRNERGDLVKAQFQMNSMGNLLIVRIIKQKYRLTVSKRTR